MHYLPHSCWHRSRLARAQAQWGPQGNQGNTGNTGYTGAKGATGAKGHGGSTVVVVPQAQ